MTHTVDVGSFILGMLFGFMIILIIGALMEGTLKRREKP